MASNLSRFLFALLAVALFLPSGVSASIYLPADTTLVFKKMPTAEAPVKIEKKNSPAKKAVAKKSVAKKPASARVKKSKPDSVRYEQVRYSLGDRIIMRGDSGNDVKKLAEIMVKNLYLDEKSIPYTKGGQVLYDGELLRAFKLFQKVSGLYEDGIVGAAAIKELRKIHRWRRTSK